MGIYVIIKTAGMSYGLIWGFTMGEEFGKQVLEIEFLDGEIRQVEETTFSRALVAAAYGRLLEGADSHKQLTPIPRTYRMLGWRYYDVNGALLREELRR